MKKILFLNSFYYPRFNVNGLCVNEICKKLNNEYEIYCLSYKNYDEKNYYENDNIKIFKVQPRIFFHFREYSERGKNKYLKKLCKYISIFIQKTKRIILFPFYPLSSITSTIRYVRKTEKICKEYNIENIVATYYPLEAVIAARYLKKKNKNIKFIMYVVDTLSNEKKATNFINKYKKKCGRKWELKFYESADLIINMRCHEENYNDKIYDKYRNKIVFSDIPLFRNLDNNSKNSTFDNTKTNLVYTGSLDKSRRDPTNICKLINHINNSNDNKKIVAHFFSRGDCESILENYNKITNQCIIRHGFVSNDISIAALYNSDAIISIEAQNSDMISAKIFEYMSTGKKIIHFYVSNNDILINYFKKYENILLINQNDDINMNKEKIIKFLNSKEKQIDLSELEKNFIENTPQFTANIIKSIIK